MKNKKDLIEVKSIKVASELQGLKVTSVSYENKELILVFEDKYKLTIKNRS